MIVVFSVAAFYGFTAAVYAHISRTESQKTYTRIHANMFPVSFPAPLSQSSKGGIETVRFEFLILEENGAVHPELYQTPGKDRIRTGRIDRCHYFIEPISGQHTRISGTVAAMIKHDTFIT